MNRATCRSCGAPIIWCESAASGKRMPLDAEPVDYGNIVLDDDGHAHVCEPGPNESSYVSHFVTCPQSTSWRKKKS